MNSNQWPFDFSWKAANYSFFSGLTLAEGYKYRLGTFKPAEDVARMHELRVDKNAILPDRFDARSRWPKLIREVRDQGNCAASWAFSTTGKLLDHSFKNELSLKTGKQNSYKQRRCEVT